MANKFKDMMDPKLWFKVKNESVLQRKGQTFFLRCHPAFHEWKYCGWSTKPAVVPA